MDATAAVLADPDRFRGVLGSFAAQLTVADGYQKAIAAALGAAAEALTVNGLDAAVEVLTDIRTANAGTVGLVIASPPRRADPGAPPTPRQGTPAGVPAIVTRAHAFRAGARWAVDLVTARPSWRARSGSCWPTSWW